MPCLWTIVGFAELYIKPLYKKIIPPPCSLHSIVALSLSYVWQKKKKNMQVSVCHCEPVLRMIIRKY